MVVKGIGEHLEKYGPGKDGLLFSAPEGGPILRSVFRSGYGFCSPEAGVDCLPPHALRHFAASFALGAGAQIAEAAELAGQSDPLTTARVYSHSMPAVARQVAGKVSAAWEAQTNLRHESPKLRHAASGGEYEEGL